MIFADENVVALTVRLRTLGERSYAAFSMAREDNPITGDTAFRTGVAQQIRIRLAGMK
jgi:hypothetical protein